MLETQPLVLDKIVSFFVNGLKITTSLIEFYILRKIQIDPRKVLGYFSALEYKDPRC